MRMSCKMSASEFLRFMCDSLGFNHVKDTEGWEMLSHDDNVEIASDGEDFMLIVVNIPIPFCEWKDLGDSIRFKLKTRDFISGMRKLGLFVPEIKVEENWIQNYKYDHFSLLFCEGERNKGTYWMDNTPFTLTAVGDEPNGSWVNDCEVTIES